MILETKFSIGDKVYAIIDDKIILTTVKKMDIKITDKTKIIEYSLNWENSKWTTKYQPDVYRTKEDIIK